MTGLWNTVTTSVPGDLAPVKEKTYPLCNFTYALALTKYSLVSAKGATEGEATTVANFLNFVAEKKGGQAELVEQDYYPLPKNVATEVSTGATSIGF